MADIEEVKEAGSGETADAEEHHDSDCATSQPNRLCTNDSVTQQNDQLPLEYQHVRQSIRKVRPEFYETVDMLRSKYHMSQTQALGAVVSVGNKMFGRQWKHHDDSNVIDLDTLPDSKNVRQAGKSIEAMVLDEIVKEIMTSDEQATLTYSEDR